MNKKDKNNIYVALYFVMFLISVIVIYGFNEYINPLWIGIAWFLGQQFYVMPRVQRLYLELHEESSGVWARYLPIYNEYSMFTPVLGLITLVGGLITSLLIFIGFTPLMGIEIFTPMINAVFGESASMNYSFYTIFYGIVSYVLLNVVRGFAFVQMNRQVNILHAQQYSRTSAELISGVFEGLRYLMFFFPWGRTISLQYMGDRMSKMVELNDLRAAKNVQFFEEDAL
jgi:hypothetical protein